MGISQHTRFENHMDVASPETVGDATRISDYFDEDPYDDDFEAKLSQNNKNIVPEKSESDAPEEQIEEKKGADSIMRQEGGTRENDTRLALNPTNAPFEVSEGIAGKEAKESPDISLNGNSATDAGNANHHHSVQQMAEKIVAVAATVDAVSDILSGGVTAVAEPNRVSMAEISPQTSIVSKEGHHDLRSINEVIDDLGFEIDRSGEGYGKDLVIDAGQAIESIGSDEDNKAEIVDEQSRKNIEESEIIEAPFYAGSGNPPNPPESSIETKKDIVYKSIVDANSDYGEGGGTQYFIPHAYDLKRDGKLQQQPNSVTLGFDEKDVFKADIRDSEYAKYKMHIDKRKLSEEETQEILDSSSDRTSGALTESISDDELRYLDENTIATEGLTDTRGRFFINENGELDSHEDYYRPHGNQEDTYKEKSPDSWVMPDSWSNPEELREGDTYYQLTAVYSDGKKDAWSSYFTDKATVDSCRDENGIVSVAALMQKLQIPPKIETIIDENGNNHEAYVKNYELATFTYRKGNSNL